MSCRSCLSYRLSTSDNDQRPTRNSPDHRSAGCSGPPRSLRARIGSACWATRSECCPWVSVSQSFSEVQGTTSWVCEQLTKVAIRPRAFKHDDHNTQTSFQLNCRPQHRVSRIACRHTWNCSSRRPPEHWPPKPPTLRVPTKLTTGCAGPKTAIRLELVLPERNVRSLVLLELMRIAADRVDWSRASSWGGRRCEVRARLGGRTARGIAEARSGRRIEASK